MPYVRTRIYENGKIIRLVHETGGVWDVQDGIPRSSTLPGRTLDEVRAMADRLAGAEGASEQLATEDLRDGDEGPCEEEGCSGTMRYAVESDPNIAGTGIGNRKQDALVGRCRIVDAHVHTARIIPVGE